MPTRGSPRSPRPCFPAAAPCRAQHAGRPGPTWSTATSAALDTRLRIPLIYGVDAVHGHGNVQGATVFPHNIGLGATRDPALVRSVATRRGGDAVERADWAFAPCLCVARDDRWGRTYESFGETPALVATMAHRDQRPPGPAGHCPKRPGAGHGQALRRRRPDHLRHRSNSQKTGTTRSTRAWHQVAAPPSTGSRSRPTSTPCGSTTSAR